jgi:hypothetical protein
MKLVWFLAENHKGLQNFFKKNFPSQFSRFKIFPNETFKFHSKPVIMKLHLQPNHQIHIKSTN